MGGGGCQGPAVPVGRSRVREEPAAPPEAIKPQAGEGAFASPALSPRCQALPVTSRLLHRECGDSPGTGLGSWGGPVEGRCPLGKAGTPGREMSPWGRGVGGVPGGEVSLGLDSGLWGPLGWEVSLGDAAGGRGCLWGEMSPLGDGGGSPASPGGMCPLGDLQGLSLEIPGSKMSLWGEWMRFLGVPGREVAPWGCWRGVWGRPWEVDRWGHCGGVSGNPWG